MDRYAHKIIKALGKKDIIGLYNESKKLVYAHHWNKYGEIFGIYEYNDGTINSSVIYSHPVPQDKKEQVSAYLSRINEFNFYIDHLTTYVVFDTSYHIEKEGPLTFDEFCIKAYNILIHNQQALLEIIAEPKSNI